MGATNPHVFVIVLYSAQSVSCPSIYACTHFSLQVCNF